MNQANDKDKAMNFIPSVVEDRSGLMYRFVDSSGVTMLGDELESLHSRTLLLTRCPESRRIAS